jgi:protein-S-isoprenylcysteine O-methyltransferase Ste14
MRFVDIPPVWLAAFIAAAWAQARWAPTPFPQPLGRDIGALAILIGLLLTIAAAVQFRRHRTSILPREVPRGLITKGIYRKSRNPIYLADVLFLAGFSLWVGSVLGLVLVPALVSVLSRRFIEGEERRLRDAFGKVYEEYASQTRRWL